MKKYIVVFYLTNGNVESDGQYFDTELEANEHRDYLSRMATDREKKKYSDIVVIDEEVEEE